MHMCMDMLRLHMAVYLRIYKYMYKDTDTGHVYVMYHIYIYEIKTMIYTHIYTLTCIHIHTQTTAHAGNDVENSSIAGESANITTTLEINLTLPACFIL